jgi:hypothetical protein
MTPFGYVLIGMTMDSFYLLSTELKGMTTPVKILVMMVVVSLTLILAGCSVPVSVPAATQPTTGPAVQPTASGDSAFSSLYSQSSTDVAAKILDVNSKFSSSSTNAGFTYSPANLRMAALDMSATAEGYHTSLLGIRNFANQGNELKRNEYLGYLTSISTAGNDIAEAASAESTSQYALAMNFAGLARTALDRIDGVPDQPSRDAIAAMKVQLDDYIRMMRERL